MVLFLKLRDPLLEHHILLPKMYQEDILLKDTMEGLDDECGGFLKRGAELYQKSIEKVDSFSLFYPQ
jgi:hypothetical protein